MVAVVVVVDQVVVAVVVVVVDQVVVAVVVVVVDQVVVAAVVVVVDQVVVAVVVVVVDQVVVAVVVVVVDHVGGGCCSGGTRGSGGVQCKQHLDLRCGLLYIRTRQVPCHEPTVYIPPLTDAGS